MNGFDLLDNYTEDPEKLLKRRKFARTRDILNHHQGHPLLKLVVHKSKLHHPKEKNQKD